jgi:hypothetical protein
VRNAKLPLNLVGSPGVVLLVTPSFATWLESKAFISQVLDVILTRTKIKHKLDCDVSVVAAVVDGLATRSWKSNLGARSSEGFAILPCAQKGAMSKLGELEIQQSRELHNAQKSSITFLMGRSDQELAVTVPLANTMFRNGRTSTLFASRWQLNATSKRYERIQQVEKQSVTIDLSSSKHIEFLAQELPLVPLTPPRVVVSGLGNIVRQVTGPDGETVSASQELEATVDAYLDARNMPKQTVSVWALVMPKSTVGNTKEPNLLETNSERIRTAWNTNSPSKTHLTIEDCLRYGRGASLHRVCRWMASFTILKTFSYRNQRLTRNSERRWWLGGQTRSTISRS